MKVFLTSHGQLAEGVASGFEFIAGKSEKLMVLELDQAGIGSYREQLLNLLDNESEPVLILADLKGGTPYNEAFKYYLAHPYKVRVISGLNLPMLLELIPQINSKTTLEDAAQIVLQSGSSGIIEAKNEQEDEDDIDF